MTDLQTLHDAFTELERRADAAVPAPRTQPRSARRLRLVPIVATMAAVAALAVGAVWIAPGDTPVTGSRVAANLPSTPDELAAKFKAVLGDMATFEMTEGFVEEDKLGVTIHGTLTADGVTGDLDLRVYAGPREPEKYCGPDVCFVSFDWADGKGTPAVMELPNSGPDVVVYGGYRDLPDDMNVVFRVSGAEPPLSLDQLALVLNAW